MDKDGFPGLQTSHIKHHVIGCDVVDRYGCSLLEAHFIWHIKAVSDRNDGVLSPQTGSLAADDTRTNLDTGN